MKKNKIILLTIFLLFIIIDEIEQIIKAATENLKQYDLFEGDIESPSNAIFIVIKDSQAINKYNMI